MLSVISSYNIKVQFLVHFIITAITKLNDYVYVNNKYSISNPYYEKV